MLKFMENPTELICQLYSEKSELALNPKEDLDLHGIAEYIATRNNVDMYELLSKLLDVKL